MSWSWTRRHDDALQLRQPDEQASGDREASKCMSGLLETHEARHSLPRRKGDQTVKDSYNIKGTQIYILHCFASHKSTSAV